MAENNTRIYPIPEDMRFQNVFWAVERVFWALLAVVPLIALTGIFAHGALSDKTAAAPNSSLSLEYERFQRQSVVTRFVVRIPASRSDEIWLRLSPSFQRTYEIQSMQPEPARSTAGTEGLDLFFHAPKTGELVALIWGTPRQFGMVKLQAEADSGGPIDFPVLIYP
jgi:hypothetical protein